MPRPELPRYSISVTLTESQLARLDELALKHSLLTERSTEHTVLAGLRVLDILTQKGMTLDGPSVFQPVP